MLVNNGERGGTSARPSAIEGRRRGRPSTFETEEITRLILSAALEVFTSGTYADASVEAIAARAGVKKDTIYKRYATKRTLLRAVLNHEAARWNLASSTSMLGDTLEKRLKAYAAHLLRHAISIEGRVWIRLAADAWQGLEEIEERQRAIGYSHAVRVIANEIRAWTLKEGKPARDPELVATGLMAMLAGWTATTGIVAEVSDEEVSCLANAAIDLFFGGRSAW